LSEQIWIDDRQVFEAMGWPSNFRAYANSGVFFFKPSTRVREFFGAWHKLWLAGLSKMSASARVSDQPSFNTAILLSGVQTTILSWAFNAQVAMSWKPSSRAVVWHFYASQKNSQNLLGNLVKVARRWPVNRLPRVISRVITAPAPWPNLGWFARRLAARVELRGSARTEEWLWLHGRRKDALRFVLGQFTELKSGYWRARRILGLSGENDDEILYRLRRQGTTLNGSKPGIFRFPWGEFEYVDAEQLRAQFEEIFIGRQYAFSSDRPDPVIIDCGGNVG